MPQRAILIGLSVAMLAACWLHNPSRRTAPAPIPSEQLGRSCLLTVLDATAATHVSVYGALRATTPHLDRLSRKGFTFAKALSQAPSTLSSVWSLMLGVSPKPVAGLPRIPPAARTLAAAFRDAGYDTAAFTENPWISRGLGFDNGFDSFAVERPMSAKGAHRNQEATRVCLDAAIRWMEARDRFFVYLHLLRPHNPYRAPPPFAWSFVSRAISIDLLDRRERAIGKRYVRWKLGKAAVPPQSEILLLEALYDGNLAYADWLLGRILAAGPAGESTIVVTSDHGEAYLEHGHLYHSTTVYDEMLTVPLLYVAPGVSGLSEEPVQLLDLFPTLAKSFSLPTPRRLEGRPLLSVAEHREKRAISAMTVLGKRLFIAFRRGRFKMISQRESDGPWSRELYDTIADPVEKRNLMGSGGTTEPELLALTDALAAGGLARGAPPDALTQEQRKELEALGYTD